ncbi:hypothetical protein L3X38_018064 [Prunus dulcis]|uniref:GAG-pre-integrase domain-containing protein n=1 Tax=Prunus dulcis TaxID=3755 RepID=A0AAD4WB29_PRUDU|nr:hypothetical protein L3X38_018064 [Prunus dulcis]
MTLDPGQLINRKSSTPLVVSNANGTPSHVVGEGSLSLSHSLHLDSVLLVPSLDHNLLSVAQLSTTLGCTVTFWPNHCVFWDILTGTTIGCGTRRGKLYYLDWALDSEVKGGQAFTTSGTRLKGERDKIWLWHKRFGHASFGYLKKLFPSLFSSLNFGSDRSLPENQPQPDLSSPCCPTQEEETDKILPTPEISLAPVPHQSPAEDVIQVTSCPEIDNINEISHDNLISEGTEPAYQIPKRKNCANFQYTTKHI